MSEAPPPGLVILAVDAPGSTERSSSIPMRGARRLATGRGFRSPGGEVEGRERFGEGDVPGRFLTEMSAILVPVVTCLTLSTRHAVGFVASTSVLQVRDSPPPPSSGPEEKLGEMKDRAGVTVCFPASPRPGQPVQSLLSMHGRSVLQRLIDLTGHRNHGWDDQRLTVPLIGHVTGYATTQGLSHAVRVILPFASQVHH